MNPPAVPFGARRTQQYPVFQKQRFVLDGSGKSLGEEAGCRPGHPLVGRFGYHAFPGRRTRSPFKEQEEVCPRHLVEDRIPGGIAQRIVDDAVGNLDRSHPFSFALQAYPDPHVGMAFPGPSKPGGHQPPGSFGNGSRVTGGKGSLRKDKLLGENSLFPPVGPRTGLFCRHAQHQRCNH